MYQNHQLKASEASSFENTQCSEHTERDIGHVESLDMTQVSLSTQIGRQTNHNDQTPRSAEGFPSCTDKVSINSVTLSQQTLPTTRDETFQAQAECVEAHSNDPSLITSDVPGMKKADNIPKETDPDTQPVECVDPIEQFQNRCEEFMKKHSDVFDRLIFDYDEREYERALLSDNAPLPTFDINTANYAVPEPLESHMGVDPSVRRQRFFKIAAAGDIVKGIVLSSSISRGVSVRVISMVDTPKVRELTDLKIKGVVQPANLCRDEEDREKMVDDLYVDDIIKAVVVSVDKDNETLDLSIRTDHLKEPRSTAVVLGYDDKDRDAPPERRQLPSPGEYLKSLTSEWGFKNPHSVDNLKEMLGIPLGIRASCLDTVLVKHIPDIEYFDGLRYTQRINWSMNLTAYGIKYYKGGSVTLGLHYLDFAIDADHMNSEALVARGALLANQGNYERAIKDLESAVYLSDSHKNAKKYLVETYIAYAEKLESKGELKEASKFLKKAIKYDPSAENAKTKSDEIAKILEKEAAENEEKERKKKEEELRMRKLRKIVRKERRKMREMELHGPKEKKSKESKEKKKKRKTKSKKHRTSSSHSRKSKKRKSRYSSDESYYVSDSYSSTRDSESPDRRSSDREPLSKKPKL